MDLQCVLCIANSSYTIKTPKDDGYFIFWCFNCDKYWNFYKKIENLDMLPLKREISRSNGRMGDNVLKQKSPDQNRRVRIYA